MTIKDITEAGFIEDNPKWIEAEKKSEEIHRYVNRIYSELLDPVDNLVKEFTDKIIEGATKFLNVKSVDTSGSLAEIFLYTYPHEEKKVSIHIVRPNPGYNKVTEATLKLRNTVAGGDIDLIIPEDASPDNVIRVIELLKPFLEAKDIIDTNKRRQLINRVNWIESKKHLM